MRTTHALRSILLLVFVAVVPLGGARVPAVQASSAAFAVTSTADTHDAVPGDGMCADAGGQCTLRAATEEANAQPAGSTIRITVPAAHYLLSLGALVLSANTTTIIGVGARKTIVDAQGQSQVIDVFRATTLLSRLMITGGGGNLATYGGGIDNGGTLTLINSAVSGNTGSFGGGLYNQGVITLTSSIVSGNTGGSTGGGIFNDNGTMTATNSKISGNSGGVGGGGIYNDRSAIVTLTNSLLSRNTATTGGGIDNRGAMTLTNSTVVRNSGGSGGGIYNDRYSAMTISGSTLSGNSAGAGGGIENNGGVMALTNVTLSGNAASGSGGGIYGGVYGDGGITVTDGTLSGNSAVTGGGIYTGDGAPIVLLGTMVANSTSGSDCNTVFAPIVDKGYNLSGDTSCGFGQTTDITTTNPLLGPLANNGGPTQTMALSPTSPAIDRGGTAATGCPATDQREVSRPQGPACDIGAYEYVPGP